MRSRSERRRSAASSSPLLVAVSFPLRRKRLAESRSAFTEIPCTAVSGCLPGGRPGLSAECAARLRICRPSPPKKVHLLPIRDLSRLLVW